jgi:hypothetical protein
VGDQIFDDRLKSFIHFIHGDNRIAFDGQRCNGRRIRRRGHDVGRFGGKGADGDPSGAIVHRLQADNALRDQRSTCGGMRTKLPT